MHGNTLFPFICRVATLLLLSSSVGFGAKIKPRDFRKFKGLYTGTASGYTSATDSMMNRTVVPISTKTKFKVGGRQVRVGISPTGQFHSLFFKRPTGNERRIKLVGIFRDTVENPYTMTTEAVTGLRSAIIKRKKGGRFVRYEGKYREYMVEGTLSAYDVRGKLRRKRG